MSIPGFRSTSVLAAAISAVLLMGVVSQSVAQTPSQRGEERRARQEASAAKSKGSAAVEERYPDAARTSPPAKASAKLSRRLKAMMDHYDKDESGEARAIADEIIANPDANPYEKSFAAQIAAQIAYDAEDAATAIGYLEQALEFAGLENNAHFDSMLMMAQLQLQEESYAESVASFDRFLTESSSQKPEHLVLKGNALYRMERFPEAVVVLEQAVNASPEPRADWMQLLMGAYSETGQQDKAAALAQKLASSNPGDKRTQMNLVAVYMQGEMLEQAAQVLEGLRAGGELTEARDYQQLYSTYLNLEGKEKQAAEVINEGLEKGVLQPDFQVYLALAQAHYFSDEINPAIDAYQKAAPLDTDGETYLNLARVLWQEDRVGEAKEAARQAIAKGVKQPKDAQTIIALPGN